MFIPMYSPMLHGLGISSVMEVIGGAEQKMGEFVSFLSPMKESNTADAHQSLTRMEGYGAQQKWIRMETMCRMRDSGDTVVSSVRSQDCGILLQVTWLDLVVVASVVKSLKGAIIPQE